MEGEKVFATYSAAPAATATVHGAPTEGRGKRRRKRPPALSPVDGEIASRREAEDGEFL